MINRKSSVSAAANATKTKAQTAVVNAKPPTKSPLKRVPIQLTGVADSLSEEDIQRIVRAFQAADTSSIGPKLSIDPVCSDTRSSLKVQAASTIQSTIDDLNIAISALRSCFADLNQAIDPILGPIPPSLSDASGDDSSDRSAIKDRLRLIVAEVRATRDWIDSVRSRVEL